MDYTEIIEQLIEEEKDIIGKVAVQQADKIDGLQVDDAGSVTELDRDGEEVVKELLFAYRSIVGNQAVEIAKRKVRNDLDTVPGVLEPS